MGRNIPTDINRVELSETSLVDGDFASDGILKRISVGVYGIIPDNSANWDTAYGWGDHAGLYDADGTASGLMSTHESAYNHPDHDTAYIHSQVAGGDSVHVSVTENTNWDTAYTHVSNDGSDHSFIDQDVTITGNPTHATLKILGGVSSLLRLERSGSADVQMNFLNSGGDTWTIGHDNSGDAFTIAASDDDFATNAHVRIDRTSGRFSLRSSQIVIDNSTYPFATSKFNSQGVAWSTSQPARTPGLIFSAIAQDRPEISWYRGSRTYPEFSIRQHTTNDMGAEIYSGGGTSAPTMTMAFNLGNVGIGTSSPSSKLHINSDSTVATQICISNANATNGLIFGIDADGDARIELAEDKTLSVYTPSSGERMRFGRGSQNGQVFIGTVGSEAVIVGDLFAGGYAGMKHELNSSSVALVQNGNGRTILSYASSEYLDILTDDSNNIVRFTGSGYVGIGTQTPGLPLEVRLDNGQQAIFFDSTAQAEGVGGGVAFGGKYTDAGAEAMAGRVGTKKTNSTSGHVGFDIVLETQDSVGSITERMILTSDAKCGINVTPFSSPTKTLDVWGDTKIRGDLTVDNDVIINSNYVVEGSPSKNILRKIQLQVANGATPGTNIDITKFTTQGRAYNAPTITDADDLAKNGTSGSYSLSSNGENLTLDISETVTHVISVGVLSDDLNNSGGGGYYVHTLVINDNIQLMVEKSGNTTNLDWTDVTNTGSDFIIFDIAFMTSD